MPRQLTFEGPTLEAALARVSEEMGTDATIVRAEKVRSGGLGGFFCRERFEVTVGEDGGDDPAGVTPPASLLDLADAVSAEEAAERRAPSASSSPPSPSTESPVFQDVLRRVAADAGVAIEPAVPSVPAVAPAPSTALLALGLPPALTPGADGGGDSLAVRLLRRLEHLPLPAPLPTTGGSVVAVVGSRRAALALAGELAVEFGGDSDDVVLAAPRRGAAGEAITSAAAAVDHRRSWRRRSTPTVVAVVAPSRREAPWAARVLAGLEPSAVWATVEADRKADDLDAWLSPLAPVDALAVTGIERTGTPGQVLGLGVPVARVDGSPATPARWTALLLDRLAA